MQLKLNVNDNLLFGSKNVLFPANWAVISALPGSSQFFGANLPQLLQNAGQLRFFGDKIVTFTKKIFLTII